MFPIVIIHHASVSSVINIIRNHFGSGHSIGFANLTITFASVMPSPFRKADLELEQNIKKLETWNIAIVRKEEQGIEAPLKEASSSILDAKVLAPSLLIRAMWSSASILDAKVLATSVLIRAMGSSAAAEKQAADAEAVVDTCGDTTGVAVAANVADVPTDVLMIGDDEKPKPKRLLTARPKWGTKRRRLPGEFV